MSPLPKNFTKKWKGDDGTKYIAPAVAPSVGQFLQFGSNGTTQGASVDLSGYVPYTGASSAVNLNTQSLTAGAATFSGDLKIGTTTEYVLIGSHTSSPISAYSNTLGYHYQLIGDSTGSGGPMLFKIGSGGTLEWRSTARSDAGTADLAIGRDSAGVLGVYTDASKVAKAAITAGAATFSGTGAVGRVAVLGPTGTNYGTYRLSIQSAQQDQILLDSSDSSNRVKRIYARYANIGEGFQLESDGPITVKPGTVAVLQCTVAGRVLVGTTTHTGGKFVVRSTTEQRRDEYDASNYVSHTVSSGGNYTIAPSGGVTNITGAATFSGTITGRASTTAAGTAPLKLSTGMLMMTPEAGAIEYDGTNLYFTDSGGTRRQLQVV